MTKFSHRSISLDHRLAHLDRRHPDDELIQSLAHRTWPVSFGKMLSAAQIDYMLDMMYSPAAIRRQLAAGHVFLLLLDEEREAIGYVSYEPDYQPGQTKVHKLYVLPERQGTGGGHYLLRTVRDIATSLVQKQLVLDVNYQNPAIEFYRRFGFRIVERKDTAIGGGFVMEDYVMALELGTARPTAPTKNSAGTDAPSAAK